MIKLSTLLKESKYNRIHTNKLKTILEKIIPTLEEKKQAELQTLFVEVLECIHEINSMPYGIFTSNIVESKLFMASYKLNELKEFILSECNCEEGKEDLKTTAIKAIDEIFEY